MCVTLSLMTYQMETNMSVCILPVELCSFHFTCLYVLFNYNRNIFHCLFINFQYINSNNFSIYVGIIIYLGLIIIFKNYYFTYYYLTKEYLVFTYVIFLKYISCHLNIILLNRYQSLHDSFLISIFNNYYFPYIFVSKRILCVYIRHLVLIKFNALYI